MIFPQICCQALGFLPGVKNCFLVRAAVKPPGWVMRHRIVHPSHAFRLSQWLVPAAVKPPRGSFWVPMGSILHTPLTHLPVPVASSGCRETFLGFLWASFCAPLSRISLASGALLTQLALRLAVKCSWVSFTTWLLKMLMGILYYLAPLGVLSFKCSWVSFATCLISCSWVSFSGSLLKLLMGILSYLRMNN